MKSCLNDILRRIIEINECLVGAEDFFNSLDKNPHIFLMQFLLILHPIHKRHHPERKKNRKRELIKIYILATSK
jgi:hypothetical protein